MICPARPRASRRTPAYPAIGGLAVISAVGCTHPSTAASDSHGVAVVSLPVAPQTPAPALPLVPQPLPKATPSGKAAPSFPEDALAVESFLHLYGTSCKGDCAPPFELARHHKDELQIGARIRYCTPPDRAFTQIEVQADIAEDARPAAVNVAADGPIKETVVRCIKDLVGSTPFAFHPPNARTSFATVTFGDPAASAPSMRP